MALNKREMWFNGIKIAFYFKKLQKIIPKASGGWRLRPQNLICDALELH